MWADDTVPAAPGPRRLLPVLLSTAFAATLVLLFMQYLAAIVLVPASRSENQVHTPAP
jgi:hypothetical protein